MKGFSMATACVFCGLSGRKMTAEHVFPNWLTKIGFADEGRSQRGTASGWLNRSPQIRKVPRPLQTTVKVVCVTCNSGWMGRLEQMARRVLPPLIRGEDTPVPVEDQQALAAWTWKTALVAMMVSSEESRGSGYGLPLEEFREVYRCCDQQQPLEHVQLWVGRFNGEAHTASVQVTPIIVTGTGEREPDEPHGYVFSVLLGKIFLQGIRFTSTEQDIPLTTSQGLTGIWPVQDGPPFLAGDAVTDETFRQTQKGSNVRPLAVDRQVLPFRSAVDLPPSTQEAHLVDLPTPCGSHSVYYPAALVGEAANRRFYAFMTMCECGTAYLVQTEPDGAHFKAEGAARAIEARYEALAGEEIQLTDASGVFFCKHLPER